MFLLAGTASSVFDEWHRISCLLQNSLSGYLVFFQEEEEEASESVENGDCIFFHLVRSGGKIFR